MGVVKAGQVCQVGLTHRPGCQYFETLAVVLSEAARGRSSSRPGALRVGVRGDQREEERGSELSGLDPRKEVRATYFTSIPGFARLKGGRVLFGEWRPMSQI